ncbi:MAG: hypothetical protein ABI370_13930 [Gammaproteobacteria bacterium]
MTIKDDLIKALKPLKRQHTGLKKSISEIINTDFPEGDYLTPFIKIFGITARNPAIMDDKRSNKLRELARGYADRIEVVDELTPENRIRNKNNR